MFKTLLIGHIGQDAVVKQVANSQQLAVQFSVAHTEKWTDAQGVQRESTTWVSCTYWRDAGKTNVAAYLTKGTQVYVGGLIKADSYINKESGELVQKLAMRVQEIKLLGSAPKRDEQPQGQLANTAQPAYSTGTAANHLAPAPAPAYHTQPAAATAAGHSLPPSLVDDLPF